MPKQLTILWGGMWESNPRIIEPQSTVLPLHQYRHFKSNGQQRVGGAHQGRLARHHRGQRPGPHLCLDAEPVVDSLRDLSAIPGQRALRFFAGLFDMGEREDTI